MRCFVAVAVPEDIGRTLLDAAQTLCREQHLPLRAVPPENLHITLKFIPRLKDDEVAALIDALHAALAEVQPLAVDVAGFSGLPVPSRARVLCSLVADTGGALAALADKVEAATVASGIERERRRFRPHITLARSKLSLRLGAEVLAAATQAAGNRRMAVDAVTLYESRTHPEGPQYLPLAVIALAAGAPAEP